MFEQFGRIVLNTEKVVSVVRDAKRKRTTVYMDGGKSHTFSKYWEKVWESFKGLSED